MTREHLDLMKSEHQSQLASIITSLADAVRYPLTSLPYLLQAREDLNKAIARAEEFEQL